MRFEDDDDKHGDIDEAWRVLGLVNDWLKHAEAKAGLALATAGVLGGLLYNLVTGLSNPPWWITAPMVFSVVFIFIGGVCGALAVVPQLRRKEPPTSKIYYDHISRAYPRACKNHQSKLPDFQKAFAKVTDGKEAIFDELSAQVWVNAHVTSGKYKWSTWAIVFVIASAIGVALTAIGVVWESR